MFNLSGSELIFLVLIALVVLGPDKLPEAMRKAGKAYADFKRMTSGFQSEMKSVLDEPMRELRETAEMAKQAANFDIQNPLKAATTAANGTVTQTNPTQKGVGPTDLTAAKAQAMPAAATPAAASANETAATPAADADTAPPATDATGRRLAAAAPVAPAEDASAPPTAAQFNAVVASGIMTGFSGVPAATNGEAEAVEAAEAAATVSNDNDGVAAE